MGFVFLVVEESVALALLLVDLQRNLFWRQVVGSFAGWLWLVVQANLCAFWFVVRVTVQVLKFIFYIFLVNRLKTQRILGYC